MKYNYEYCLQKVLESEGGYSNNPADPGGPTNYGITLADYRKYINVKGTAADVKTMKLDDAKKIYRARYWDSQDCDNLTSGVDYSIFDYGVNSGIGRSKKVLAKFSSIKDPVALINAINDERLKFLKSLSTWSKFGRGWGPRVVRVRADSLKLYKGAISESKTTATAAVVVAGGVAAATSPEHYVPWVIGGVVLAAILTWVLVHFYRKGSTNV